MTSSRRDRTPFSVDRRWPRARPTSPSSASLTFHARRPLPLRPNNNAYPTRRQFSRSSARRSAACNFPTRNSPRNPARPLRRSRKCSRGNSIAPRATRSRTVLRAQSRRPCEPCANNWHPAEQAVEGLAQFTTSYNDMTGELYLVWDPVRKMAIAFDTGADCRKCLGAPAARSRDQAHPPHPRASRSRGRSRAPRAGNRGVGLPFKSRERAAGGADGRRRHAFEVGGLTVEALLTSGHSAGGMSFFIGRYCDRRSRLSAIRFSPGRWEAAKSPTTDAPRTILTKILTLPNETDALSRSRSPHDRRRRKRAQPIFRR